MKPERIYAIIFMGYAQVRRSPLYYVLLTLTACTVLGLLLLKVTHYILLFTLKKVYVLQLHIT